MALHPTNNMAYVVLEGDSLVLSYAIQGDGSLAYKQKVILTKQWSNFGSHHGSEIVASQDGKFVYASSRGNNGKKGIIAVYKVLGTGLLEWVQEYELSGTWPRSMVLTPDDKVLAVALEKSGKITTLSLNRSTGKIENVLDTTRTNGTKPTFITLG